MKAEEKSKNQGMWFLKTWFASPATGFMILFSLLTPRGFK